MQQISDISEIRYPMRVCQSGSDGGYSIFFQILGLYRIADTEYYKIVGADRIADTKYFDFIGADRIADTK